MKINKRKWFFIVPIIIFAFNIAVIATLIYFFLSHRVVIEDIRTQETEIKLRDMREQRPEIHAKYRETIRPLNNKNRDLRLKFMKELSQPEPDYEMLSDLNKQIQEITNDITKNFYNEMIETRKSLSPQEAERFYGCHLKMMERKFNLDQRGSEMNHEHPGGGGMLAPPPEQGRMMRKRNFSEDN